MNLTFKEITLRNFLSFGNIEQKLKLDEKDFRIITGKNLDKSNTDLDKNGTGKTTIFQAIHFALFGKSIGNKVTLPNLINNINKKCMEVSILFEKNGIEYKIERGRNPTYLKFYKNNEEITDESLGDSRDTQDIINQVIGMNEDVFTQIVLISCSVPMFLDQTTSNQKAIIEKILGVDIISDKINNLKSLIKDTKNNINNETFKYNTIKNQNDTILNSMNQQMEDMANAKLNRINNINHQIEKLEKQYNQLSSIDIDEEMNNFKLLEQYNIKLENNNKNILLKQELEKKINHFNTEINKFEQALDILTKIDFTQEKQNHTYNSSLSVEIEKYKAEENLNKLNEKNLKLENDNLNKLNEKIKLKENEINNFNPDVCPTCKQTLLDKSVIETFKDKLNLELNELKEQYHQLDLKILDLVHEVSSFTPKTFELKKTIYNSIEETLQQENSKTSISELLKKDYQYRQETLDKLETIVIEDIGIKPTLFYKTLDEITNHKSIMSSLKIQIDNLKQQLIENPFEQQERTIESMRDSLIPLDDTLVNNLTSENKHQETLLKLLNSPSSFIRKTILDKSLEFLNDKISYYLASLGSLHEVYFNNDMTLTITSMGVEYGYVSSGEMGRISIALTLAFRDVWESLNNCYINLLSIDEIIDRSGLDTSGIELMLLNLKKKSNKNILLVTHNDSIISQTNNIITVVKENGFSEIL